MKYVSVFLEVTIYSIYWDVGMSMAGWIGDLNLAEGPWKFDSWL